MEYESHLFYKIFRDFDTRKKSKLLKEDHYQALMADILFLNYNLFFSSFL